MRNLAPLESISSPTAATKVILHPSGTGTAPPATAIAQHGPFASTLPRPWITCSLMITSGPPGTVSMWLSRTSSLSPVPRSATTLPAPSRCEPLHPKRGSLSASILAASASCLVGLGTATRSARSLADSGSPMSKCLQSSCQDQGRIFKVLFLSGK